MTDSINKIGTIKEVVDKLINDELNTIQELVNKYIDVLKGTIPEKDIPYLAYLIDVSFKYVNDKHVDLPIDWKTWSVVVVRRKYLNHEIINEEDIKKTINTFVRFWKVHYKRYCEVIIPATDYDRDRGFVYEYLWRKKKVVK